MTFWIIWSIQTVVLFGLGFGIARHRYTHAKKYWSQNGNGKITADKMVQELLWRGVEDAK